MKQILMFVMFSAFICWLMFAPIYKHVLILRQAILQKEIDYLLEVGANGSHGYIDAAMTEESKQRLTSSGFDAALLEYAITTSSGIDGTNPGVPVPRGTGIGLRIAYPYLNLFDIDRLIGITQPASGSRMSAAGMKMSEYVP